MAIYSYSAHREQFVTIDKVPDFRSPVEKQYTPLSIYNHDKPDIAYAERMAEELINISGAWVKLFLKEPKRDTSGDEIWDEDADPLYQNPRTLKAFFKPEPTQTELTKWGIDIPLRLTLVFSRAVLMQERGIGERLLNPGDVIEAPYNLPTSMDTGPLRFRVANVKQDGFFQYRWLYVNVICELITGDAALRIRTTDAHDRA